MSNHWINVVYDETRYQKLGLKRKTATYDRETDSRSDYGTPGCRFLIRKGNFSYFQFFTPSRKTRVFSCWYFHDRKKLHSDINLFLKRYETSLARDYFCRRGEIQLERLLIMEPGSNDFNAIEDCQLIRSSSGFSWGLRSSISGSQVHLFVMIPTYELPSESVRHFPPELMKRRSNQF